jgi:uncharacterized protein (TIGR02217 family)
MAFDDVRLPEEVESGSVAYPRFQTTIVTLGRGAEQRNVDWAQQRMKFDISYGISSEEEFMAVVNFFYARMGRARGFRFKDWTDYKVSNQYIGVGDGTRTKWQLFRRYSSGGVNYDRKIICPVSGSSTVYVDGSPVSHTLNTTTGEVTLAVAPAAAKNIYASFEFDVPVRFDSDELPVNISVFNAAAIGSIELVELPTRT